MTDVLGLNAVAGTDAGNSKEAAALDVLVQAAGSPGRGAGRKELGGIRRHPGHTQPAGVVVEDGLDGATWSLKRD